MSERSGPGIEPGFSLVEGADTPNAQGVEGSQPLWHNGPMAGDAFAGAELAGDILKRSVEHNFGNEVLPWHWNRIIIAANRSAFEVKHDGNGNYKAHGSPGGLVTALAPFMESGDDFTSAKWIGWPGNGERGGLEEALRTAVADKSYDVGAVILTPAEYKAYYEGYCNQVLWPLFHGKVDLLRQDIAQNDWQSYLAVNKKFAEKILRDGEDFLKPTDFIFVQDYQLMAVAKQLRDMGVEQPIAHFLHIPFPNPEVYGHVPQREELLDNLLNYDLLGFQTDEYRDNFVANVMTYLPDAQVRMEGDEIFIDYKDRKVRAHTFPISIDARAWEERAQDIKTTNDKERLRRFFHPSEQKGKIRSFVDKVRRRDSGDRQFIFELGRADYTKGFYEELLTVRRLLQKYPEWRGKISLLQAAQPSRENIGAYKDYKAKITELANEINKEFSTTTINYYPRKTEDGEKWSDKRWEEADGKLIKFPKITKGKVVHQIHRGFKLPRLVAHYGAADVMSVFTTIDGMNLVAKEASVTGNPDGTMVLGQGAGAARELGNFSIVVDTNNIKDAADKLNLALTMRSRQKKAMFEARKKQVEENDIHKWKDRQIAVWRKIWRERSPEPTDADEAIAA